MRPGPRPAGLGPRWGVLEHPLVHGGVRFLPKEHELKLKSTSRGSDCSHVSPAWEYLQFLKTMVHLPRPVAFSSVIPLPPPPAPTFLPPTPVIWRRQPHGLSMGGGGGGEAARPVLCTPPRCQASAALTCCDSGRILGRKWAGHNGFVMGLFLCVILYC